MMAYSLMFLVELHVMSTLLCLVVNSQDVPNDLSATFSITEQSPPFTYVGNIVEGARLAHIFNSTTLDQLEYSLIPRPGSPSGDFQMDSRKGEVRSVAELDRDIICPGEVDCYIHLDIAIVKPSELFQVISVQVNVLDVNDQPPVFTPSQFNVRFSESDPVGTTKNLPVAVDLDSPQFGVKEYRLGLTADKFTLLQVNNPINGLIDLKLAIRSELDRELRDNYQVLVEALDHGTPPLMGSLLIHVTVEDDNDHSPVFSNDLYEVQIPEDLATHTKFFTIEATDNDQGDNGKVIYEFSQRTSITHGHLFNISHDTGYIFLNGALDFENEDVYHLEVTALDLGPNQHTTLTTVKVMVSDVNDNVPAITISTLTDKAQAEVSENLAPGQFTAHVSIIDADSGQNGVVSCLLTHNLFDLQEIRTNQYKITTAAPLDREAVESFVLRVDCSDLGSPPLSASENITVSVLDDNDHEPVFSELSYSATVPENIARDTALLRVVARDADIGINADITYHILDQDVARFVRIDRLSGTIHSIMVLDYEEIHDLSFTVRAMDRGRPTKQSDIPVVIRIQDMNDHAPAFQRSHYTFSVSENQPPRTFVGTVSATDADSPPFDSFEYSLSRQNELDTELFSVDSVTGEVYTRATIDHEEKGRYHLIVYATDSNDHSLVGSAFVSVTILDHNDNNPIIHFPLEENTTFPISNRVLVSYNITKIFATDPDNGQNSNITYSLLFGDSDLFRIDPRYGFIQTNSDLSGISHEVFELTVRVSDGGEPVRATDVQVIVVVDDSVPFYLDEVPAAIVQRTNLTIIISVAVVSGFVIVVLVVAIVLLKTTHHSRPIFPHKLDGDKGPRMFTDINVRAVEAHGQLDQKADVTAHLPARGGLSHNLRPGILHKYEMEIDTHSMSSADVSNTDSGRGPSELGGDPNHRHDMTRGGHRRLSYHMNIRNHHQHTTLQSHTGDMSNHIDGHHGYQHIYPQHPNNHAPSKVHEATTYRNHDVDNQELKVENLIHFVPSVHQNHSGLPLHGSSVHGTQHTANYCSEQDTGGNVGAGPKRVVHAIDV